MYASNESDDWPNLVNTNNTPSLVSFHKFSQIDRLGAITVHPHDLICTGLDALKNKDNVSLVLKISIFPIPGKAKILRTTANVDDNGSCSFNLSNQSVEVSMSTADIRGRAYSQGYSPVIKIEISINNKEYTGSGEVYVPGVFTLLEDDILSLPISMTGSVPGFEAASLLLDIKPSPVGKIVRRRKPQTISLWTYGLTNKVMQNGSVHVTLSCCEPSGREWQQLTDVKINKKATEFDSLLPFQITSIWPEGDVLRIKICDDKDNEYGEVVIPVSAILSGSMKERMAHRVWSNNGKEISPLDCFLICSAESTDAGEIESNFGVRKAPPMQDHDVGPEVDEMPNKKLSRTGPTPEPLSSLGGRLLVCLQGFTYEGKESLSGQQRYLSEICLYPTEGSSDGPWADITQACAPQGSSKTRMGVEWGKSFELPVAYALSQRYPLHLGFKLFEESSKGGKKRCLGESSFDIVSLVTVRDHEIMTFFLPVFTPDTSNNIPSDRKELGKYVISVQFISEKIFSNSSPPGSNTLNSTQNLLGKTGTTNLGGTGVSALTDSRGNRTPGKSVVTYVQNFDAAPTSGSLSANRTLGGRVSHSEVGNAAATFWKEVMSSEFEESPISCYIQFNPLEDASNILTRFGDELSLIVDSMTDSFITKLRFDDFEDSLTTLEDTSFEINTNGLETAIALNICVGRNENACCECWIVLSKSSLTMGLPTQLDLPLRDSNGLKAATVRLGCHATSPSLQSSKLCDESLRVTFLEGYVSDPTWPNPLELYFEFTMLPFSEYNGDVGRVVQGRTSWAPSQSGRKSKDIDIANMQCTVDIPTDAVPEKYKQRVPSSANTWSLSIVGRDASRPGAPAIVTGRVNVSWTTLISSKTIQEKIMLRNGSSGRSIPVSVQLEKIKKGTGGVAEGSDGFEGIGSALFWFVGAQFPREDFPIPPDSAEVTVRWSMKNELSGQPFDSDAAEVQNSDGISSAIFAKAASIQQFRNTSANPKPLVISVPLPGGFSDLKISVKCGTDSYSTILPTLASLSKPNLASALDLPKFNVMTAKEGTEPGRCDSGSSPRVLFNMLYVPYVTGKLVINVTDVRLEMLPNSWVLAPGIKHSAIRVSVGTLSHRFTPQFTIKEIFNVAPPGKTLTKGGNKSSAASLFGDQTESNGGTSKFRKNMTKTSNSQSGVPILQKAELIEIPLNTFDLLNCPSPEGTEECLDLRVSVLDLDSLPNTSQGTNINQMAYVRASGVIPTAPLYYMAMRDVISQPPVPSSKNRGGCSPDVQVTIPLIHPGTGDQIGTLYGSIKFCMFGGAEDVIADIADHIKAAGEVENSLGDFAAELGLKQAYAAADKDNSGGISKCELINIFMSIKSQKKTGKQAIVGFDDRAIKALMDLMNVIDGDDANNDQNILEVSDDQFRSYLEDFFLNLDLDGDGVVSWWEWRQVLYSASLIRNNIRVKYMDHLDPLLILYLAAHHGLQSVRENDPSANVPTTTADLQSYRMISWGDNNGRSALEKLVEELAKKNRELEDALARGGSSNDAEANARIRIARDEADAARRLLDAERSKSNRLQSEIDGLYGASNALGKSRAEIELENQKAREALEAQSLANRERIALAHWQRKKKAHSIELLQRALLRWINRRRKDKLGMGDLDKLMVNVLPSLAATNIERVYRGSRGRRRAKKMWWAIYKIQEFCRTREQIRLNKSRFADLVKQMTDASNKIQSAYKKSKHRRDEEARRKRLRASEAECRAKLMEDLERRTASNRAASKIQKSFRARLAWKELMLRVMGKKIESVDVISEPEAPSIHDAINYWIRLTDDKGVVRQGFVNDVNVQQRQLFVVFEDSSDLHNEETVSYGNPSLKWFRECNPLVEKDGIPKKMNLTNMYDIWLIASEKPFFPDAKHYWIRVANSPVFRETSRIALVPERQYYYAYVVDLDTESNSLVVFSHDFDRKLKISYNMNSSDLRWYDELTDPEAQDIIRMLDGETEEDTPPVSSDYHDDEMWLREIAKPSFSDVYKRWVLAINMPGIAPQKSIYGVVIGSDEKQKLLKVYFDELAAEKLVPYNNSKLRWYESMSSADAQKAIQYLDSSGPKPIENNSKANENARPSNKSPRERVPFTFAQPVLRPPPEEAMNGYYVRIVGTRPDDIFDGKIVGVTSAAGNKKMLKLQSIRDGLLTDEYHMNVPYQYRDPNRMIWFHE